MTVSTIAAEPEKPLLGTAPRVALWVAWHVAAAVLIPLALSEIRLNLALWEMSYQVRVFLLGLAVAHVLTAAILSWQAFRRGTLGLFAVLCSVGLSYGLLFVALQAAAFGYSRSLLGMAAGASFVLTAVSLEMMSGLYRVVLPALLIASVGLAQVALAGWPADDGVRSTTYYSVRLVNTGVVVPSAIRGGAIAVLGDDLLVASGDGALFSVRQGQGAGLGLHKLRYEVPLHRDAYKSDGPDNIFGNDPFRVTDVLVENLDDRFRLFVSHHYWQHEQRCVGLRVSVTEASRAAFLDGTAQLSWRTLYDSQPCLKLVELRYEQSGGTMVRLDPNTLLLSVGDHNLDGFYAKASAPQDPKSHYGKTIRIDTTSGAAEVYTLGHRNPQGLWKTADGRIWLTEQGPAGGDELNLLKAGSDYGWPRVSYGAAYDKHTWPPNADNGFHRGFVEPFYAWLPSVAVTTILGIEHDLFPIWKGDLLVASLKGFVIRLRVDGDRVIFAEPIYATNTRIRDMTEAPDGRFILFQDDGAISAIERVRLPIDPDAPGATAPPDPRAAAFRSCQDCHRLGEGTGNAAGPNLRGIIGRKIASAPGFDYSDALKGLGGSWTEDKLNRFLQNPAGFAPGTSMQVAGIDDADTRRILIDYLAHP